MIPSTTHGSCRLLVRRTGPLPDKTRTYPYLLGQLAANVSIVRMDGSRYYQVVQGHADAPQPLEMIIDPRSGAELMRRVTGEVSLSLHYSDDWRLLEFKDDLDGLLILELGTTPDGKPLHAPAGLTVLRDVTHVAGLSNLELTLLPHAERAAFVAALYDTSLALAS